MRGTRKFAGACAGLGVVAGLVSGLMSPVGAANPNLFGVITHSITLPDTPAPGATHIYFVHVIPSVAVAFGYLAP